MATGTCQITISLSEACIITNIAEEKFIRKIPFDYKTSDFKDVFDWIPIGLADVKAILFILPDFAIGYQDFIKNCLEYALSKNIKIFFTNMLHLRICVALYITKPSVNDGKNIALLSVDKEILNILTIKNDDGKYKLSGRRQIYLRVNQAIKSIINQIGNVERIVFFKYIAGDCTELEIVAMKNLREHYKAPEYLESECKKKADECFKVGELYLKNLMGEFPFPWFPVPSCLIPYNLTINVKNSMEMFMDHSIVYHLPYQTYDIKVVDGEKSCQVTF